MRVLMVGREYPPYIVGGVATHTYHLTQALRRFGVKVDVVSFGNPARSYDGVTFIEPRSAIIKKTGIEFGESLTIIYDIARLTKFISNALRRGDYDVVHVQEPYVGGLVRFDNKVTTIHDTSYGEVRSIFTHEVNRDWKRLGFYLGIGYFMEYSSMATSKVVIVPSPQVRDELISKYKFSPDRVRVVMNGVDPNNRYLSIDKVEAKERLGISKPLIFASSQHVARKRLDVFLYAMKVLDIWGVLDDVEVRVGGDGPLRTMLEGLAERLGIRGKVRFMGWLSRDSLELHYRAADVFVITSDYEAGPITMLEAMVAETPVVSTRIRGFPELARDGVDALLVEPGDYVSVAKAIREVLVNEDLARYLARNGRDFAMRFTWDRVAESVIGIYREVVGG
jgi:glycosyltransferase involved in cell wall biosynthesis